MSDLKKQVAEQILAAGILHVHVDPRRDGIVVPEHREAPRGLVGRPLPRGEVVPMPYRTVSAGCSFCQDTHKATVAGAHARICDACLDLASDTLPRA